jgi:hypothetical protein
MLEHLQIERWNVAMYWTAPDKVCCTLYDSASVGASTVSRPTAKFPNCAWADPLNHGFDSRNRKIRDPVATRSGMWCDRKEKEAVRVS